LRRRKESPHGTYAERPIAGALYDGDSARANMSSAE